MGLWLMSGESVWLGGLGSHPSAPALLCGCLLCLSFRAWTISACVMGGDDCLMWDQWLYSESLLAGLQCRYLFCLDKPHLYCCYLWVPFRGTHCLHLYFVWSLLFYDSSFTSYWMLTGLILFLPFLLTPIYDLWSRWSWEKTLSVLSSCFIFV